MENNYAALPTNQLLGTKFTCDCGKDHIAPVDQILVGKGILETIGKTIGSYGYKNIFVVADQNTYLAAGERVIQSLEQSNLQYHTLVFTKSELIPNEESIGSFLADFDSRWDLILAVGSGVINDICKYMALKLQRPLMVVATAPSMDGYLSDTSAMTFGSLKVSKPTQVPQVVFGDIDVLKNAPMPMILAGYGDVLGKLSAVSDWQLSHEITGEYYCPHCGELAVQSVMECNKRVAQLQHREEDAIQSLFDALMRCGIAMTFVQNSRPASGSEHLLSHYWELQYLLAAKKALLHGTKVGITSVMTAKLREVLKKEDPLDWLEKARTKIQGFDQKNWEQEIKEHYLKAADEVIQGAALDKRNDVAMRLSRLEKTVDCFDQVLKILDNTISAKDSMMLLQQCQAPASPNQVGISAALFEDSLMRAKDNRSRYTLLTLLNDLGCLEDFSRHLTQEEYHKNLGDVALFMLDMDGTIYLEDTLIPGAKEFLVQIKEQGKGYVFVTNNSSKGKEAYIQKLGKMGIEATKEEILTSGDATIDYLKRQGGNRIFLLGTQSLKRDFEQAGFVLVENYPEPADYVVLGFDTELDYQKIHGACDYIVDGVPYIATHPDINCPLKGGRYMPDAGAMAKMIEASTGKTPFVIGKPEKYLPETVMKRWNLKPCQIAMVGDRLYTDMKMANQSGIQGILVLSGESTVEDLEKSDVTADHVFSSVVEIFGQGSFDGR